jgi:hypothetical protein
MCCFFVPNGWREPCARASLTPTYVQDLRVRFIVVVLLFASIASSASMLFLLLRGCCFFRVLGLDSCTEDMRPGLLHGTSCCVLWFEVLFCIENWHRALNLLFFLAGKGATVKHSQLHDFTIALNYKGPWTARELHWDSPTLQVLRAFVTSFLLFASSFVDKGNVHACWIQYP